MRGTGCMGISAYDHASMLASNIVTSLFFILLIAVSYVVSSVIFLMPPLKRYGYTEQKKTKTAKKRKGKK
jgi:hypothetical protein